MVLLEVGEDQRYCSTHHKQPRRDSNRILITILLWRHTATRWRKEMELPGKKKKENDSKGAGEKAIQVDDSWLERRQGIRSDGGRWLLWQPLKGNAKTQRKKIYSPFALLFFEVYPLHSIPPRLQFFKSWLIKALKNKRDLPGLCWLWWSLWTQSKQQPHCNWVW